MAGNRLVIGDDPNRAVKFANETATAVPGGTGALVVALDPKGIATELLKKQGGATGAALGGAFVAPLKDFTGHVQSETSGLTARFKLTISG